jgi:hypothetical protein
MLSVTQPASTIILAVDPGWVDAAQRLEGAAGDGLLEPLWPGFP